ncbi:FAD/NAD(P)-binding protein [Phenylobacterium sp.]|uniref:FAD/NAD(P)-binding protein n=1 Tax=Phenylobacterium sp. TaxID=1871053 RepID=UPI001218EE2E|nr:FAD/NAD(P)-binding protein [Phenylobacterium sp.]THD58096.1 MAG: hypothetical protein E8A49_20740 [Phenylobacterium sp.]
MMIRDRPAPARPTVAVIGGGFSGLLTAIHLLHADPEVVVRLVERAPQFGRGRAYGTENPDHLLNVRVANMSAFPDEPEHFAAWLRAQGDCDGPGAFVSRSRYGDYLQSLLRGHLDDPGSVGRLLLEQDEAVDIVWRDGRQRVELKLGRGFAADASVLAVGSPLPAALPGADEAVIAAPNYAPNPWSLGGGALPQGEVLVVGSGLTMVDVAIALSRPGRRLTAVSRHGLLPRAHAPTAPHTPPPAGPLDTPARALRTLRAYAGQVGWREAVDSIRPQAAAIWRGWPLAEKRRFLRHLQSWWDVHRHRMAPAIAARVETLVAAGDLEVLGGRLARIRAVDGGFEATFQRGSDGHWITRRFEGVVNCTGLRGAPQAGTEDLLGRLAHRGALRADPLGLGLDVDGALRVIGQSGAPTPGLFAVGPLTRGAFWEAIAVPDLRIHTALVAGAVLEGLRRRVEA